MISAYDKISVRAVTKRAYDSAIPATKYILKKDVNNVEPIF